MDFFRSPATVVFDLDGTLTTRDTLLPLAWTYGRRHRKYSALTLLPFVLAGYGIGILGARASKQCVLARFFGGDEVAAVRAELAELLDAWLPAHFQAQGMKLLTRHQQAGHRVILLSASLDLYVPLIGERLGIAETIATAAEIVDGRITGRIAGENLKGPAKVAAISAHLGAERASQCVVAYGDSRSDLPLLGWADHGYLISGGEIKVVPRS